MRVAAESTDAHAVGMRQLGRLTRKSTVGGFVREQRAHATHFAASFFTIESDWEDEELGESAREAGGLQAGGLRLEG